MLQVGLTGGIGSGKSTVAKLFELMGIPVYNSDSNARKIMTDNAEVRQKIIDLLGAESYIDNSLNKSYIADKVFQNTILLQQLNHIVHPYVFEDFESWCKIQSTAYVIKESALLLDTLEKQRVDQIIVVFTPLQLRIKRIMARDHLSLEATTLRMSKQRTDKEFIEAADYILINDEHHPLIPQVKNIHIELLNFAQ